MNLLKKFLRHDNYSDQADDELYTPFEEEKTGTDAAPHGDNAAVAVVDDPERKNVDIHPASSEKVSVKILRPSSPTEAPSMVLQLKKGTILVVDLSLIEKADMVRTKDFLAGAVFALGGEIYITNPSTLFLAPIGVDITGFVPDMAADDDEDDYDEDEDSDAEGDDAYGEIEDPADRASVR